MTTPNERLHQLDGIERQISSALQCSASALLEIAKEKPGIRHVENHTSQFLKTLESVESGLSKHIQYLTQVSTGQPHEGSVYAAQKDMENAYHRTAHVKTRLSELECMKNEQRLHQQTHSLQRTLSHSEPLPMHRGFPISGDTPGIPRQFSQGDGSST